jgi:aspartate-semialdehyde dehydrogenase
LAVVGATGAIGRDLVELLRERGFSSAVLKLFATEASASAPLEIAGTDHPVDEFAGPQDLSGFDVAFLAVPRDLAAEIRQAKPGPILIDLSAANRAPSGGVPLVAPGQTLSKDIAAHKSGRIFEVPHPAAQAVASILNAVGADAAVTGVTVMMGASAHGRTEVERLIEQSADLLNARLNIGEGEHQLAFNIDLNENPSCLADAIGAQALCLLNQRQRSIPVQVVNVPVLHGIAITMFFALSPLAGEHDWLEKLRLAPGLIVADEGAQSALASAIGQEAILLSARPTEGGGSIFCVLDNTRRTALGAVWIVENLASGLGGAMN